MAKVIMEQSKKSDQKGPEKQKKMEKPSKTVFELPTSKNPIEKKSTVIREDYGKTLEPAGEKNKNKAEGLKAYDAYITALHSILGFPDDLQDFRDIGKYLNIIQTCIENYDLMEKKISFNELEQDKKDFLLENKKEILNKTQNFFKLFSNLCSVTQKHKDLVTLSTVAMVSFIGEILKAYQKRCEKVQELKKLYSEVIRKLPRNIEDIRLQIEAIEYLHYQKNGFQEEYKLTEKDGDPKIKDFLFQSIKDFVSEIKKIPEIFIDDEIMNRIETKKNILKDFQYLCERAVGFNELSAIIENDVKMKVHLREIKELNEIPGNIVDLEQVHLDLLESWVDNQESLKGDFEKNCSKWGFSMDMFLKIDDIEEQLSKKIEELYNSAINLSKYIKHARELSDINKYSMRLSDDERLNMGVIVSTLEALFKKKDQILEENREINKKIGAQIQKATDDIDKWPDDIDDTEKIHLTNELILRFANDDKLIYALDKESGEKLRNLRDELKKKVEPLLKKTFEIKKTASVEEILQDIDDIFTELYLKVESSSTDFTNFF